MTLLLFPRITNSPHAPYPTLKIALPSSSDNGPLPSIIRFIFLFAPSFIRFGYFYSATSSALLLRGASDYSIGTVSELTRRNATGNCK